MMAYAEAVGLKLEAASRDGAEDSHLKTLKEERENVTNSAGKRLVWMMNMVFPCLLPRHYHKKESLNTLLQQCLNEMVWMDPMSPDWSESIASVIARAYLQRLCIIIGKVKSCVA